MTNNTPQLEDGFTPIANEVLENLCKIKLSSYQIRIILFVLRKTYGYHKKDDWISVSQIVEATSIKKSHVSRTKKELLLRKIVTSNGNKIAFQKDSTLWCELPKQVTNKNSYHSRAKVTNSGQKVTILGQKLPVQGNTIYNIQKIITKDNNTKESNKLISMFGIVNPSYKELFKNKTERSCSQRLIEQYGMDKLANLINRLPEINSTPYAPSITSPYELEVKMGKLLAFLQQESLKVNKFGVTKV